MVEGYVLEYHILLDIRFRMTSSLEAADVAYLVMRLFNSPPRDDIGEPQLDISKLRPEMVAESGLIVAFGTGHIPMRGCLPRIDVYLHVVAQPAERGRFGITPQPPAGDKYKDEEGKEGDGALLLP